MEYSKMISGVLSGAWNKIGEVAEDIAGSESFKRYYKRIIPGSADFGKEVVNSYTKRASAESAMASMAASMRNLGTDVQDALHKAKGLSDIEKIKEKFNLSDAVAAEMKDKFSNNLQQNLQNINYEQRLGQLNPLDKSREKVVAYFTNPDKAIQKTRIAAAAGTYGAVAVGSRYMTGGTLTRDQYGRRDIAGIPFI